MSTLDSSSGDIQDQPQGAYSPYLYPRTPSPASTFDFKSTMQIQPQDAPNSPPFCTSSPPPTSFDTAASTVPPPASPTASPPPKVCSEDATNLPYPNAECYLMRPEVLALMAAGSRKEPKLQSTVAAQTTGHHLPLLYQESQIRGLTPRFEIEGDQRTGFGGNVKIGEETITAEEKWQTKRAAKEGLAAKAMDIVKTMPSQKRKRSATEVEENWIGMLHDHYMPTRSTTGGPIFLEYTVGTAFACTCKIPSHPNPFGSESKPLFTTKKAARSNAAKEAMQFLIAHGLARSDGNCKKKESKRAKLDAAVAMAEDTEATFARKVNELCPLLSLPLPEYRLLSSDSSPPNLFSGAAYFPASTPLGLLPTLGPIGSVTDVCGRKAAKDQCAKMLVEFLTERMKIQDVWKIMGKEASGDKKVGTDGEKEKGD